MAASFTDFRARSRLAEDHQEASAAVAEEPLLGGMLHACVLHHGSWKARWPTGWRRSCRRARCPNRSCARWRMRPMLSEPALGDAARADIVAVFDRDPACHRFLQPLLYFKGFQAIQAYRVGHWMWAQGPQRHRLFHPDAGVRGVRDRHPPRRADRQGHHDRPRPFHRDRRDGGGGRQCLDAAFGDAGRDRQGDRGSPPQDRRRRPDRGGAKVLGNIRVGNCSRIAAGSVVLEEVPPCKTVAGFRRASWARRVRPAVDEHGSSVRGSG
jgi:serine O-acetyltransferase